MIPGGENSVAMKQVGPFTYLPYGGTSPDSGTIVEGPFVGWKIAPASDYNNTEELNGIRLTPEIAAEFRKKFQLTDQHLYVSLNAAEFSDEGAAYFAISNPLKNPTKIAQIRAGFTCDMVDEKLADQITWQAPLGTYSPCDVMKKNLTPGYMTYADHVHDLYQDLGWKGTAGVGGIVTLMIIGVTAGYNFFWGGAIYQRRAAMKAARNAAKKVVAEGAEEVAEKAVREGVEETAGKAGRVAGEEATERTLKVAGREAMEETGEAAAKTAGRSAMRVVARETAGEGAEATVKKGVQKLARKAPVPFYVKAGLFVVIEVGAALVFSGDAEASESTQNTRLGSHYESDSDFREDYYAQKNCGASTACYLGNWALTPLGWIAKSESSPAY